MSRETFDHEETGISFRYDGDYTGDVTIVMAATGNKNTSSMRLPLSAVVAFVAEMVRQRQTDELVAASDWEVLGVTEDDDEDDEDEEDEPEGG